MHICFSRLTKSDLILNKDYGEENDQLPKKSEVGGWPCLLLCNGVNKFSRYMNNSIFSVFLETLFRNNFIDI